MKFRNVRARLTRRYYLYVIAITLFLFSIVALITVFFSYNTKQHSLESFTTQSIATTISSWKEGGIISVKGVMYKKTIKQIDYYVIFSQDSLKYIVTFDGIDDKQFLDRNLGVSKEFIVRIQDFLQSIPLVTIVTINNLP